MRSRLRPDLVLLDIWMPDTDGVTLLKEWSATGLLTMPVIMMSGHATIDTAVEATKIGAQAFLEKPITLQKLLKAVEQGLLRNTPRKPPLMATSATSIPPDLTVEAAMTGGQVLPPVVEMGPQSNQSFLLDKPLRDARDEFEKAYFEFHLAKERRLHDPRGRENRARTHPPVPQAQAARCGPFARQAQRGRLTRQRQQTRVQGPAIIQGYLGPVAQLVEQRIENPRVGGSIPPQATKFMRPSALSGSGAFRIPGRHPSGRMPTRRRRTAANETMS